MKIKCVTACYNAHGEPDFHFCIVDCTQEQYDAGDHYIEANTAALHAGYEGEGRYKTLMIVFDENDGPKFLFDHFEWGSASVVKAYWEIEDDPLGS